MRLEISQSSKFVPLIFEGDSHHRALEVGIESLKDEIKGSSDVVCTVICSPMQSLSRVVR